MKQARLRPLAAEDLVRCARQYVDAGGGSLAGRFFEAAIESLRSVEQMPGIGSPSVGERIGVPGLRRAGIAGSPLGWYYLERSDHLDIVRLLADRQDVDLLLGDD